MNALPTTLACLAALAIGSAQAAPCRDGGGTGAWVYNGVLTPHFTSLTVRCAQSAAANYSGIAQYEYGPDNVTLGLSASIGEPGHVHARASSVVLSSGPASASRTPIPPPRSPMPAAAWRSASMHPRAHRRTCSRP